MKCNACEQSFRVNDLAKFGKRYYCFDCCMKDFQSWEGEE